MQRLRDAAAHLFGVGMVTFEWLPSCRHAGFRAVLAQQKRTTLPRREAMRGDTTKNGRPRGRPFDGGARRRSAAYFAG
jgi:hypothetical protein